MACAEDVAPIPAGYDDGSGNYVDPSQGQYVDPSMSQGYYQQPYTAPQAYPAPYQDPYSTQQPYASNVLPGIDPTGLTPGFGTPFQSQQYAPSGCRTGSNLPRCLIFEMAQEDRQQFNYIFTILQQMYAQLLQIVQQLMAQLQQAQMSQSQQPPYYGPQGPYGQPPYGTDPYSQGAYGQPPFGYGGGYGSPYGASSSQIPDGIVDGGGGGPFDAGSSAIPGDISQVYPGPRGPMAPQPDQAPNIISSDSLPDGAGPSTGDGGGTGEDAPVPAFTPAPTASVAKAPPATQTVSQSVNAGPNQPYVIVQAQQPGQAPYADGMLPAGENQEQPQLEPPSQIENWAQSDWA